uniref:Uncharacterized protein n=1 Tax=Anguilla anguilla TaxID=7936 RepID=A0A0E9TZK9_ANGAN
MHFHLLSASQFKHLDNRIKLNLA